MWETKGYAAGFRKNKRLFHPGTHRSPRCSSVMEQKERDTEQKGFHRGWCPLQAAYGWA